MWIKSISSTFHITGFVIVLVNKVFLKVHRIFGFPSSFETETLETKTRKNRGWSSPFWRSLNTSRGLFYGIKTFYFLFYFQRFSSTFSCLVFIYSWNLQSCFLLSCMSAHFLFGIVSFYLVANFLLWFFCPGSEEKDSGGKTLFGKRKKDKRRFDKMLPGWTPEDLIKLVV